MSPLVLPVRRTGNPIALEVLPEVGAKILTLTDERTGRQWLAPRARPTPSGGTSSWQDGDCAGWDECFPNITPGRHPIHGDIELPDHGELWNHPWHWRRPDDSTLTTWTTGRSMDYRFERTLTLDAGHLDVTYRLTNTGELPLTALWAMHMLIDADPRDLEIPDDVPVVVESTFGLDHPLSGQLTWGTVIDAVPDRGGWAVKLFTVPGALQRVVVRREDACLTVVLARNVVTFGLWLNQGGWPSGQPLRHVGIEPCIGNSDELGAAQASGGILKVRVGEPFSWSVKVHLDERPDRNGNDR